MIDKAKITISAGNGGDGVIHFKRAKHKPFGGPDGGDGGNGGNVYITASEKIKTLELFKRKKEFRAEKGEDGKKNFKKGAQGEDLLLKVPIGTVVNKMEDNKKVTIADLYKEGQKLILAEGGKGGLGNAHFKTSTNRSPRRRTTGTKGDTIELILELKLLSDIGFIGFPNAGKSTLLNSLTNAKSKTAEYQFTTLEPHIGILKLNEGDDNPRSLVLADLPGLIEGASKGKGLGEDFLRHAERCGLLVHLLDPTQTESFYKLADKTPEDLKEDILEDLYTKYESIRQEIKQWSEKLVEKPEIVVLNKIDITEINEISDYLLLELSKKFKAEYEEKVEGCYVNKSEEFFNSNSPLSLVSVSAYTGEGTSNLIQVFNDNYSNIIKLSKKALHSKTETEISKTIDLKNVPNKRIVYGSERRENV